MWNLMNSCTFRLQVGSRCLSFFLWQNVYAEFFLSLDFILLFCSLPYRTKSFEKNIYHSDVEQAYIIDDKNQRCHNKTRVLKIPLFSYLGDIGYVRPYRMHINTCMCTATQQVKGYRFTDNISDLQPLTIE